MFGSALQSVWVQGFIAIFLLVLALGMFGLYEMQMPASVQMKLGGVNRVGMAPDRKGDRPRAAKAAALPTAGAGARACEGDRRPGIPARREPGPSGPAPEAP